MSRQFLSKLHVAIVLFSIGVFFTACATNSHSGPGSGGSGSGGSGGSGSGGSGGSGGGSGNPAPGGFAAGIGGAGQTSAAHFLVGVQVPGSIPIPTKINSSGTLTATKVNFTSVITNNPMAMSAAIDPSGTFLYEAVQPGLWGFTINRQTWNITEMPNTPVAPTQIFDAVAVDQLGKFVYAYGGGQIFAFTIQPGTGQLSPITGSPFGAGPTGQPFPLASDRMAVAQNDKFLYVATSSGIMAYAIDPNTGALTMIAGSPFGGNVASPFAIVAPSSGFLYETAMNPTGPTTTGIYGYTIDPDSGALTSIAGSPFSPGCSADNLTSPANGKFLFAARCGMYQINPSTGALTYLFNDPSTPNSIWAVFDPAAAFVWIVTQDQNCWHCDVGVTAFQVDPNTGNMTMVPNSFFVMQNSMTGAVVSLAITH